MAELEEFRRAKDAFFAHDPHSPLTPEQRRGFRGLSYYPEDGGLVVEAELERPEEAGEVLMQTSTGGQRVYRRAGLFRFEVEGRPAGLTLYASEDEDTLFLPFRDATNGRETYPAGRYLDVEPSEDGRVRVDFNLAYNPYCAYNELWTCPLPPVENWLDVPIRAGEREFPGGPGH